MSESEEDFSVAATKGSKGNLKRGKSEVSNSGYDSESAFTREAQTFLQETEGADQESQVRGLFLLNNLNRKKEPRATGLFRFGGKKKKKEKDNKPPQVDLNQKYTTPNKKKTIDSSQKSQRFHKTSFEQDDGDLDIPDVPKKKLKPRKVEKASPGGGRARSNSSWAEKASKMRRSIRLKSGMLNSTKHFLDDTGTGPAVVRVRRSVRMKTLRKKKFYLDQLKNQMKGVANKLTGENLMQAKLMGAKGFWTLGQLLHTHEAAMRGSVVSSGESDGQIRISKFFMLKTGAELCELLNNLHSSGAAHGGLTSDTVLFDRSLELNLMKPMMITHKGSFDVRRIQNEMVSLGVILTEMFCLKKIDSSFCPTIFKAQALLSNWKVQKVQQPSFMKAMKSKEKGKRQPSFSFASLEKDIMAELGRELDDCLELRGLDNLKDLILKCFSGNPDERPMTETVEKAFLLALDQLRLDYGSEFNEEEELLKVLETVISNHRLMNSYIRGPRLVEIAPTRMRTDGLISTAANGYVTDDSHFPVEDEQEIELEHDEDNVSMFSEATEEVEEVKKEKPRKKSKMGLLRAFLSHQKDPTREEMKNMMSIDETQSNAEDSSGADKVAAKRQPKKKKKFGLDAFKTLNRDSQSEDLDAAETQSVDESFLQQKNIHSEVQARFGINPETLQEFENEFAAKKVAKKNTKMMEAGNIANMFMLQKRLDLSLVEVILTRAQELLSEEPNLVRLEAPVTIVGDIHGQFFDLMNMMQQCGAPGTELSQREGVSEKRTYLFLGDYVDRGSFSCEVLLYLLVLKINHPEHVWLLRGNHESKATSGHFGFKEECDEKYGTTLFPKCCNLFKALPIAALVSSSAGKFFCLHGGISPSVKNLNQFTDFDRAVEPTMWGFLCDVLWADPVTLEDDKNADEEDDFQLDDDLEKQKNKSLGEFFKNPLRGCSFRFGLAALMRFLTENELVSIVRAHQVQSEGYHFHYQDLTFENYLDALTYPKPSSPEEVCPPIITVFSAPNYCHKYGNKAAYLNIWNRPAQVVDGNAENPEAALNPLTLLDPVQFEAVNEPPAIKFPNEKAKQFDRIEEVCPYMPTGFDTLISKALSLQTTNVVKMLSDNAHEVWNKGIVDESVERTAEVEIEKKLSQTASAVSAPIEKKDSQVSSGTNTTAASTNISAVGSKNTAAESSWAGFSERMKAYEKAAQKKYGQAQREDRMQELNPLIMEKAQNMMKESKAEDFDLPDAIKIIDSNDEKVPDENERKRASFALSKLQEEKAVNFQRRELICLQALFLLIDTEAKGKIGAIDLVNWTESSGGFITPEDAEHACNIIDFDKDGFIGFEDYLVFAAACKKIWLAENLAGILTKGLKKND